MSNRRLRDAGKNSSAAVPKRTRRCEEVLLQLIVREYDEHGRVVGEQLSQPVKVFRTAVPDVWAEVDRAIAAPAPMPQGPAPDGVTGG